MLPFLTHNACIIILLLSLSVLETPLIEQLKLFIARKLTNNIDSTKV